MTNAEKAILYAALAVLTAPLWLYTLAAMADSAMTDSAYPYTGFCPDSPEHFAE